MRITNNYVVQKNKSLNNNQINNDNKKDFKNILNNAIDNNESIVFSKHANKRINNREINLSSEQMTRISKGIENAKVKGIKDTLILVDDIALVVNVKNNIVVTAMANKKESIFTNIDGAVIV